MGKWKEGLVVPETTKRECPHLKTPVAEVKWQVFETLSARWGHIGDGELWWVTAGPQHLSITIRRQQIEEENRRDRERREREDKERRERERRWRRR